MGSVHARGDTFLTFGLKALTETNTSRLATAVLSLVGRLQMLKALLYTEKTGPLFHQLFA
jgi:hypothetical protein